MIFLKDYFERLYVRQRADQGHGGGMYIGVSYSLGPHGSHMILPFLSE